MSVSTDLKPATHSALAGYAPERAQEAAAALGRIWLAETPPLESMPPQISSGLRVAGTPVSVLDAIGKEVGREARKRVDRFLPLAQLLWDEYGREGRVVAATMLGPMELAAPDKLLPVLPTLAETCAGWEDADQFAMRAVEPVVRKDPAGYLERMGQWVADPNPWVRRVGVTVLARVPMKHPGLAARCLELVEPALDGGRQGLYPPPRARDGPPRRLGPVRRHPQPVEEAAPGPRRPAAYLRSDAGPRGRPFAPERDRGHPTAEIGAGGLGTGM